MCDFLIYRAHHSCATKSNFGCHKIQLWLPQNKGGKGGKNYEQWRKWRFERSTFGYGAVWHCPFHPWAGGTDDINDQFEFQHSSSKHRDYTPKVLGVTSFRSVCFKKLFVKLYRRECLTGWRCRKWEGDEQISRQRVQSAPFEIWERGTPPLFFSLSRNRSNSTFRTCPKVDFRWWSSWFGRADSPLDLSVVSIHIDRLRCQVDIVFEFSTQHRRESHRRTPLNVQSLDKWVFLTSRCLL